jgi:hypothetical protein
MLKSNKPAIKLFKRGRKGVVEASRVLSNARRVVFEVEFASTGRECMC